MKAPLARRPRGRQLGLVAAAGPILFAAGWVVGAARQPGFRVLRDDESSLAAIGAAHPAITMTTDTLLGAGLLALAAALAADLVGRQRAVGCWLLVVAGISAIVQALVREDCVASLGLCAVAGRSDMMTWRQPVHDGASLIAFVALLVAPLVLARSFRALGWATLSMYSMVTSGVGLVTLIFYVAASESAIAGLAELIFLAVPLAWVVVVGMFLAKDGRAGRTSS